MSWRASVTPQCSLTKPSHERRPALHRWISGELQNIHSAWKIGACVRIGPASLTSHEHVHEEAKQKGMQRKKLFCKVSIHHSSVLMNPSEVYCHAQYASALFPTSESVPHPPTSPSIAFQAQPESSHPSPSRSQSLPPCRKHPREGRRPRR